MQSLYLKYQILEPKSMINAKADAQHPKQVNTTKLLLLKLEAIIPKKVADITYIVALIPQNINHGMGSIFRYMSLKNKCLYIRTYYLCE